MRRSEIQPLPTASWIGWCIRLTGSSCKENRCAKSEAAKTEKNEKSGRELWKWRGYGKRGKPKAGFPLFPQPLGNLAKSRRDSHIPTAPATTPWESGKAKTAFPLSHRVLFIS